jgi:single-strand DNA-binding protein
VKSQPVGVGGELTNREYTDKDGNKRTSLDVRVNDLALLGKRDGAQQERSQPAPQRSAPAQSGGGFGDFDDSIPF